MTDDLGFGDTLRASRMAQAENDPAFSSESAATGNRCVVLLVQLRGNYCAGRRVWPGSRVCARPGPILSRPFTTKPLRGIRHCLGNKVERTRSSERMDKPRTGRMSETLNAALLFEHLNVI